MIPSQHSRPDIEVIIRSDVQGIPKNSNSIRADYYNSLVFMAVIFPWNVENEFWVFFCNRLGHFPANGFLLVHHPWIPVHRPINRSVATVVPELSPLVFAISISFQIIGITSFDCHNSRPSWRRRSAANTDSIAFVARMCYQCTSGKS